MKNKKNKATDKINNRKVNKSEENMEEMPEEIQEILDDPKKASKLFTGLFAQFSSYHGPPINPLMSKIESKHIDKLIDLESKRDDHISVISKRKDKRHILYFFTIISAVLIVFFALLFTDNLNLIEEFWHVIIAIFGGAGFMNLLRSR